MTPYPILEFDPSPRAVIEPTELFRAVDVPRRCVLTFFQDVIANVVAEGRASQVATLRSEIGINPIYEFEMEGERLTLLHPGVGAPLAAAFLEEAIALGCREFIACGGAGVLDSAVAQGHVLVPISAIRDEGTSYHYLPPSREVAPSAEAVLAIEATLEAAGIEYLRTKTWTTDAIYRETPALVTRRREEGALAVEMEAAAFFAVAQFRGVRFGQILYGGDDISGEVWDGRDWLRSSARERLFWLSAAACLRL